MEGVCGGVAGGRGGGGGGGGRGWGWRGVGLRSLDANNNSLEVDITQPFFLSFLSPLFKHLCGPHQHSPGNISTVSCSKCCCTVRACVSTWRSVCACDKSVHGGTCVCVCVQNQPLFRLEEHTSVLQSLEQISYADLCFKRIISS